MRILVDMDDTIENLLHTWLGYLNERYGLHVTESEVHDWQLDLAYPSLSKSQVYGVLLEDELWQRVIPFPYAQEYMQKLLDDGHEIYVVTSSNYQTLKTKMERVLFRYFPFIDWNHVVITANKQMVIGDVLVDDAPHNHIGGNYLSILMDSPHNMASFVSITGEKFMRRSPDMRKKPKEGSDRYFRNCFVFHRMPEVQGARFKARCQKHRLHGVYRCTRNDKDGHHVSAEARGRR